MSLALVSTAACHSSPAAPTGNAPSLTLTLVAPPFVLVGATGQSTVTAASSAGAASTAGVLFSSSASSVATVNGAGVIAGLAPGSTTITASLMGQTASQAVRVVPDLQGDWSGTAMVVSCDATGQESCSGVSTPSQAPIFLCGVAEANDVVSATLDLEAAFPLTGTIGIDGSLSLSGTADAGGVHLAVENWQTTSPTAGAMAGAMQLVLTEDGKTGEARASVTLPALTRAAGACDAVTARRP